MRKILLSEEILDADDEPEEIRTEPLSRYFVNSEYDCEDVDYQDGKYFFDLEQSKKAMNDESPFDDIILDKKKSHAALYLHLHQELMTDERYKATYDFLRDESMREKAYFAEHCIIEGTITEEDRDIENFTLSMDITMYGKKKIETYKKDAEYIVNRMAAGESLIY